MKVIVFEDQTYHKLVNEIKQAVKEATSEIREEKEWLSTEEAKKMLGFRSKSKMQQLRDHGEIVFSQHGRTIKYSKKSILDFLERNTIR